MDSYDKIVADIALCHAHGDICCLQDRQVYNKIAKWIQNYGLERTYDLIKMACACQTTVALPPPSPPPIVPGGGPPVVPPPAPPPPSPPPPVPPPVVLTCAELPPQRDPSPGT